MCEPKESSQLTAWMFSPELLDSCRARANRVARKTLAKLVDANSSASNGGNAEESISSGKTSNPPVEKFARVYVEKCTEFMDEEEGPWETSDGNPYLTPAEEELLVSFYASKLPSLIGPMAQVPRLRRESKVPATAAMLLRRFYMSNSVMVHDPKVVMVAAAFLAAKVEDAMTDVRYLEEGTNLMNAPVTSSEIIPAEINLLSGVNFELFCFHPYKAVLSITEDMRTYLKSEKGRSLVRFSSGNDRPIVGQDLKPMHDAAQLIVNDVIVSDIPLLYPPGQVGLAALMVANEQQQGTDDIPFIDILGYLSQRFENSDLDGLTSVLDEICTMLRELKEGKHGCANHDVDMVALKGIHKKLKKCRLWGAKEKKKKRKKEGEDSPNAKKAKTSE
jgi:cyclin H